MGIGKSIAACALIALAIAGTGGCNATRGREVVAIEKTGTYHRAACPPVRMARTRVVTVEEAHAMKLRPCPLCHPDSI